MATLTVQTVSLSGIALTDNSCDASGDTFTNDGRTYVYLKNSHASQTLTATFATPQTITGASLAVADHAPTVASGAVKLLGPFPKDTFNSSGAVSVTYANPSSCTIAVFKLA